MQLNSPEECNYQELVDKTLSQQIESLAAKSNLTVGQLLLWLGQKLNPEVPLYNMVFHFTIEEEIEPLFFQQVFQTLFNHCDVLRLTFTEFEGVPWQQVSKQENYSLPFLDFSQEKDPKAAAQEWLDLRLTYIFDLENCLFDSALLKLGSDRFIWYLNQHHLITDNWSVALLYRYLQAFYQQAAAGNLTTTTNIPSYFDYVDLEKKQRQSALSKKATSYWQQKRSTLPHSVPLYGQSRPTSSVQTKRTSWELGWERSQALRKLALLPEARSLSEDQSLFNLFLTLAFAYLYRISGRSELAIACPIHNRPTPTLKETPGVFIELFPLVVEIEPEETFLSLLEKVKRESLNFLRYAQPGTSHYATDRKVNVVLSYVNVSFPNFLGRLVQTQWMHSGYGDSQHHLRLEVHDFSNTGNLTLNFDFNTSLVPEYQRQWAVAHFSQLLDALLSSPQQLIDQVDIIGQAERSLLLTPSTDTLAIAPNNSIQTLVGQFQQQVTLTPNKTAVVFQHQTLTYGELDHQANQLAHYLAEKGVKAGAIVGLFLTRSIRLIVSILGVLKAGAAYLPLDPDYPTERTAFILADAGVALLLTEHHTSDKLPLNLTPVADLDADNQAILRQPTHNPETRLISSGLAYVLYTSGSTGQPKGVMVEHRQVLAMLRGFEHIAPARETLQGTAVCSYSFDVSVWEFFSNLCFGGTLHLLTSNCRD